MKKIALPLLLLSLPVLPLGAQQLISNPTLQGTAQSDFDLGAHVLKNGSLGSGFTAPWANVTGKPTSAAGYGIVNGAVLDAWGAKAVPSGPVVGTSDVQALTGKTVNGLTINTTTGAITIGNGKTFTSSNTLILAGTDGSTLNIGTGGTLGTAAYTASALYPLKTNNLSDLASLPTARANLGLATVAASGSASDLGAGTLSDARLSPNVALKNGANTWSNPQFFTAPTTLGSVSYTAASVGWYRIWNDFTFPGLSIGSQSNIEFKVYAQAATGDCQSIFDVQWTDNIFKQFGTPLPVGVIHSEYYTNQAVTQIRTCVEGIDIFVAAPNTTLAVTPISDPAGLLMANFAFSPSSTVLAVYNLPKHGSITLADFTINGHLVGGGTAAPTIAAGAGAGTSPTVAVAGTDLAGTVGITTGTAPTAAATVATLSFHARYAAAPTVLLTPANAATAALSGAATAYISATSTATFTLTAGSSPLAASTAYKWNYHAIQ